MYNSFILRFHMLQENRKDENVYWLVFNLLWLKLRRSIIKRKYFSLIWKRLTFVTMKCLITMKKGQLKFWSALSERNILRLWSIHKFFCSHGLWHNIKHLFQIFLFTKILKPNVFVKWLFFLYFLENIIDNLDYKK